MARPARLSEPGSDAAAAGAAGAVFSRSHMHTLQSSPPLAKTPVVLQLLNAAANICLDTIIRTCHVMPCHAAFFCTEQAVQDIMHRVFEAAHEVYSAIQTCHNVYQNCLILSQITLQLTPVSLTSLACHECWHRTYRHLQLHVQLHAFHSCSASVTLGDSGR